MSINYPNTEPLVEEVLKNFFTEVDAEEFNSNYLAVEQPQGVSDEKFKEKFGAKIVIMDGKGHFEDEKQPELLNEVLRFIK